MEMSPIHPARTMAFSDIRDGLAEARAKRLVSEQAGPDGLRIYCYSQSAVFDRAWTPHTLMARGLILDVERSALRHPWSRRRKRS